VQGSVDHRAGRVHQKAQTARRDHDGKIDGRWRLMTEVLATVAEGVLVGTAENGIARFMSVPYAAPPVGERRFAAPQPVAAWSGRRDATRPGATAPQAAPQSFPKLDVGPIAGPGWVRGDDYLTLNIWRPDDARAGRPVIVFIHGGGSVAGSKDVPLYDGSAFARDGVVCVSMNYRLGIEGFLPIPGAPTNLGLRDQIFALAWVRDNIAAFGGDSGNVTIFGESGGAVAVGCLAVSPLAKGLFRRAIMQSGYGTGRDIPTAMRLVRKLAQVLKVTPDVDGFRRVAIEDALAAQAKVSRPFAVDLRGPDGVDPTFGISRFLPVHGDDVLPDFPLTALAKGAGAEIDMLIGTNAEELSMLGVMVGMAKALPRFLVTFLLHRNHPHARAVLKTYGMGRKGTPPIQALSLAASDLYFRARGRLFAEKHQGRTHYYEFDWRSPALDGALGAAHGMELPFVFDTLATASGPKGFCGPSPPQSLADSIHAIWVRFATDGALDWPEFEAKGRMVYSLTAGRAAYEAPLPATAFIP
jgi:para-nitrobenzyl esterase